MALEQAMVIRAALALLNEVGLDGLTVRRLAERLGVQNPALYWHFKNKQELLNRMAETLLTDAFAEMMPPANPADWAPWLAEVAHRFYGALLACRDGARVMAEADLAQGQMHVVMDLALQVLVAAGFDLHVAFTGIVTLIDYALGAAFEEQSEPLHTRPVKDEAQFPFDGKRFPTLARIVNAAPDADQDRRATGFAAGVALIIAGLRAQ